jgi:Arc/MetJ family transcription regulator
MFYFSAKLCIHANYIHINITMRTNIVIDDKLMAQALKACGATTKKEAVELGLKLLVRQNKQQAIRKLRGKLKWEGDLNEMRGG